MMKKKMIVLALGVATISGSAMAWESNGLGGAVDFGGIISTNNISTKNPWEVLVGSKTSGLDANVGNGVSVVKIPLMKSIPLLGIRTKDKKAFSAAVAITPQIDYGGKIDLSKFDNGSSTLTIDVKDSSNSKIGTMTAPVYTAAIVGYRAITGLGLFHGLALPKKSGDGFYGGLSTDNSGIPTHSGVAESTLDSISPDFSANWTDQGAGITDARWTDSFSTNNRTYSAYYGSGIEPGKNIVLNLDTPFNYSSVVKWNAQLPITVSYN